MTEPTPTRPSRSEQSDEGTSHDARFRLRSRALGDPTRYAIYREIARRQCPVAVAELTDVFDLNHNTVRRHLAKLCEAGLLEDFSARPHGPGRPRILYRLTEEAAAAWNSEGPYERLSLLLLQIATTGASALEVGRAAGTETALDTEAVDPLDAMTAAMTAQGFSPSVRVDDTEAEVVLEHCPFAAAAEMNAEVVCALHRGMLEGLVARVDGLEITDLVASDPRRARCLVRVTRDEPRR